MLQVSQGAKVIHFVIVLCNVQKDITLDNDKQEHKHNEILALGPGDLLHNITTVLLGNLVAALHATLLHNITTVLLGNLVAALLATLLHNIMTVLLGDLVGNFS